VTLPAHGRTVKVHDEHNARMMSADSDAGSLHPGRNTVTYEARLLKALLLQVA